MLRVMAGNFATQENSEGLVDDDESGRRSAECSCGRWRPWRVNSRCRGGGENRGVCDVMRGNKSMLELCEASWRGGKKFFLIGRSCSRVRGLTTKRKL